jgi:hypothetical protein
MLFFREMYVLFPCYICPFLYVRQFFCNTATGHKPIVVNNNNNKNRQILQAIVLQILFFYACMEVTLRQLKQDT